MYEPFWWVPPEAHAAEGNPRNRVALMEKCAESVDAFERRVDAELATSDDVFGPIVSTPGFGRDR